MIARELIEIVQGTLLVSTADMERPVSGGLGADLMSDVLAWIQQPDGVLITGLCNPQVVRTAVMSDIAVIILVRGKTPHPDTLMLAEKERIPIISSPFGMYDACGRLNQAGLPGIEKPFSGVDEPCPD